MTAPVPDPSPSSSEELARSVRGGNAARAAGILAAMEALYGLPTSTAKTGPESRPGSQPEAAPGTTSEAQIRPAGSLTDDGGFVPFYFTDPQRAETYAREHSFLSEGEAVPAPRHADPKALLRSALDGRYAGIVIDPGTEDPAVLTPETMKEILGVPEGPGGRVEGGLEEGRPSEAPGPGPAAAVEPPPPHPLDLAQRVRRSPFLDPVPAPDIPPARARELLQELRQLQMEDRIPVWEVVDTLAFQMRFFVPVAPDPAHGLRWPLVVRHPRDREMPSVWIFTDPDEARRALEPLTADVETLELSGLEAFRWIWAVPTPVREVVIDLYPDSPPPFFVPDTWMLGALYPHFMECPDLGRVDKVPLSEIGALPGARGTKPECVRALVEGWADLERSGGGPTETVRHAGDRYLPVITSPERRGATAGARGFEPPPESDPPFRSWLTESVGVSGVVLDPDGPHPLILDHTDLAVLALWSETGRQPDGTALAELVEELREELGAGIAGRILADWPRYFWTLQAGGSGVAAGEEAGTDGGTRAMTLPERDTCPVFTSEEKIRRFLEECRNRELVGPGMQALVYLSGWAFNVFREIHVRYREGGWLNPDTAPPDEGMEIGTDMVRSSLARIEWRLQPRVPGFLANP
ncbi:MAG: hypothetical protein ACOC8K_05455 [Gemmatimonadota bacterium]